MIAQGRRRLSSLACVAIACALLSIACSEAPADTRIGIFSPNGSEEAFGPVGDFLGHRCGSLDCHGSGDRNLRIWSCEGMRLASTDASICSRAKGGRRTTPEEHVATYRSLVGLEPVVMSTVVENGGADPELLTFVRKARGTEAHKGGALIVPGDAQDQCITTWLSGRTNLKACSDAFVQPKFPPAPSSP
jgi:hypothetical protein